jgi:hypothetical protein
MPSIRFKDKNGNCFILYGQTASWGTGDIQTAPVVQETITGENRCSNSLTVTVDGSPRTIYFNTNGRTGSCNQCGQCCSHLASTCPYGASCGRTQIVGLYHACPHLIVGPQGIGKKNGTTCGIYNRLLYEGYKSCVPFPSEKYEIGSRMTACGYRFP